MKLLLTSAGLRNQTLRQALRDLLGKPFGSARFVHIPTASNVLPGDRVYVGISGGSMIFSRALDERSADIFEDDHLRVLGATTMQPPFGFFDWYLQPHLCSPAFPNWDDAWADRIAARADFPIYFIDDDSAVRVDGDVVDVIGEGRWRYMP